MLVLALVCFKLTLTPLSKHAQWQYTHYDFTPWVETRLMPCACPTVYLFSPDAKASCSVTARWARHASRRGAVPSTAGHPPARRTKTNAGAHGATGRERNTHSHRRATSSPLLTSSLLSLSLLLGQVLKFIIQFRPPLGSRRAPPLIPTDLPRTARICAQHPSHLPRSTPAPRAAIFRPDSASPPVPVPAARNRCFTSVDRFPPAFPSQGLCLDLGLME
jgi:hypothetical protein